MRKGSIDYFLVFSLSALILLSFFNLGNQYLWQDEAENAVIAQNILKYGYPRAFDGSLLVVSDIGYRKNYTWIFQPWLQNYVTAASIFIFGKSAFSARIPFALFGILSFLASYFLAKRLFSLNVARISSIILALSVPYLLLIRQARYYSLALFFALLLIHAYLDYVDGKRHSEIKVILASFFLFNSNFGLFFPITLGLTLHYAFFYFRRDNIKRDLWVGSIVLFSILPIFIYFKGWLHKVPLSFDFISGNIKFYLRSINRYVVPIRLMLIVYLFFALLKRKFMPFKINESDKKNLWLIFFIFTATIAFMGIAKFRSLRYVIYLIPLLIIFESYILANWFKRNRVLPAICVIILVTTDLFNHSGTDFFLKILSKGAISLSERYPLAVYENKTVQKVLEKAKEEAEKNIRIKSYITNYLYEITHDYDGPIEGIVEFLNENAKPGDTVKIPYGDCAVAFYTNLRVDNKMEPGNNPFPEWIIPRDYWTPPGFYNSEYFKRIQEKYEKIVLDSPDLRWENRPDDLGYHRFHTVKDYPKSVIIYKKR